MDEILNDAPCGLLSFFDDGRILRINATLCRWLGRPREDLDSGTIDRILSPGARVFYQTHFFPLLKISGAAEEIYLTLQGGNGELVPVMVNAVRRVADGSAVNDCVVVRMRQRDRFEDELIQARRVAEEASQAKSRFLSMMSHELRTPLQAIALFAELLASGKHGPVTGEQLDDLRRIRTATGSLVALIEDILNFARLETGKLEVRMERVEVAGAIRRAGSLLRPRFEEAGIEYQESAVPGLEAVADPVRLQQVLLNLLTNALKFTPRGGTVRCEADASDPTVRIRVRDTGSGIPAADLQRIFDPFVQVERTRVPTGQRGVGLGLAISRELARAMRGDLTVDSEPGQGSVFTVELSAAGPEV
ncbi:MAG: PAS domain-containing sensor histidine kinase [Acidobacteriota bacterium]